MQCFGGNFGNFPWRASASICTVCAEPPCTCAVNWVYNHNPTFHPRFHPPLETTIMSERKHRNDSPTSSSLNGDNFIVDHHSPHVTDEQPVASTSRRMIPSRAGEHSVIKVQPLKQSEMQVCTCRQGLFKILYST